MCAADLAPTLYLIEILHQTTTIFTHTTYKDSCILSKFYIKPQLRLLPPLRLACCILSKFYIKPQRWVCWYFRPLCCILSKFYIKPQLRLERELSYCVVSYRNSTSNHNRARSIYRRVKVVSYRNSTSNHNHIDTVRVDYMLYLIEILHQTTTCGRCEDCLRRCILSKFYIKPQQRIRHQIGHSVVSYRNSTSNHNSGDGYPVAIQVVSYRNSTSNHNSSAN